MLLIENIKLALTAIRTNKMRSFLTMLGIIIGISSVIAITSIGASAKGAIQKEFESLGSSYMYVLPNWQVAQEVYYQDYFTEDDIDALKQRFPDDIKYAEPYFNKSGTTKVGRQEAKVTLMGVGANYDQFYKSISVIHGRMVNEADVKGAKKNVVIDVKAAKYLFGKENVVGETLPVATSGNNEDLTIVGVYKVAESFFASMGQSSTYSCYMAHSAVKEPWEDASYFIEIYANPDKSVAEQGKAFADYLVRIKDKEASFYTYESAEGQMSMINQVLGIVSLAIGAIAAISLLVGGIGIMNIMLVSVTERTREIGIRKSLGARTKDILTQFLIEAMILSIIGGIIGTILGIGIAGLGMSIAGMGLVIQPMAVGMAVLFSAAVGLFFGLFPARKAAKLDPIEALRYE